MAMKKIASDKADPNFKPKKTVKKSAMGQSAKAHQKDLAKISGRIAGKKVFEAQKKSGKMNSENIPSKAFLAQEKAKKKTAATFKKSR